MSESPYIANAAVERELAADATDSTSRNVIGATVVLLLVFAFVFVFFGYLVPWYMGPPL